MKKAVISFFGVLFVLLSLILFQSFSYNSVMGGPGGPKPQSGCRQTDDNNDLCNFKNHLYNGCTNNSSENTCAATS